MFRSALVLSAVMFACLNLTGCVVAGFSSGGGWFIWPGSLGLLFIVAILFFLFRGR